MSAPRNEIRGIEPISPELVLVDPELAALVRSLAPAPLWVPAPKAAPAPVVELPAHRLSRRRAYLSVAWAAAVLSPVAAFASVHRADHGAITTDGEPLALDRAVERVLPPAVPDALARHPQLRAVVDPGTGLVRTGTAITCRVRYVGSFWCTLRAPHTGSVTVPVRRTATGVAIMNG